MTKHDDDAELAPEERATQILVWLYGEHDPDATKEVHAYIAAQISTALAARDAEIERLTADSEGRGDALASTESQVAELTGERDALRAQVERMREVCSEIQEIMQTYRQQEAENGYVDTPGGLEHMGDVWMLLGRWDTTLAATAKEPKS